MSLTPYKRPKLLHKIEKAAPPAALTEKVEKQLTIKKK